MTRLPLRAAWLLVATVSSRHGASALSVPLDTLDTLDLWQRASGCSSGFSACQNAGLPSNFCCPAGSVCIVLAANTTIMCCPQGGDCSSIHPVTCDVSQQDADLHPDASIKTTALNGVLPACGTNTCCPFGYSCSKTSLCVLNANQNASPIQTVPTATATAGRTSAAATTTADGVTVVQATTEPTATTTTTTATTASASAESAESAVASADNSSKGSSTASIVGGVIGGLAGLLMVGAGVWFLCGRRRARRASVNGSSASPSTSRGRSRNPRFRSEKPDNSYGARNGSTSSFGNIINNPLSISISSPKPQGDATAFRTDFIRKLPSSSAGSPTPTRPGTSASGSGLLAGAAPSSTVGTVGTPGTAPAPAPGGLYQNANLNINPAFTLTSPLSLDDVPGSSPSPLTLRQRDSVPPIRGMRSFKQPKQHPYREPSLEEINVGADPSIIGQDGGNFAISPPGTMHAAIATAALAAGASTTPGTNVTLSVPDPARSRGTDRLTTFSSLMLAANLDPEQPFVLDSVQSSPASRRR